MSAGTTTTGTAPRRRRPRRTTWRWHLVYTRAGKVRDELHYTRDDAETAAHHLPDTATGVALYHLDGGGWRTDYPIRPLTA